MSRFAGVSEAGAPSARFFTSWRAKREPAGEILTLSGAEGEGSPKETAYF